MELLRLHVDIIVAAGPEARIAAMKATSTTPIVAISGSDPVAEGWASNIARPGGTVTGLTVTFPELLAKKVELLKQMVPGLSRLAVMLDPAASSGTAPVRNVLQAAASALAIDVALLEVQRPADLGPAVQRIAEERRQGLVVAETAMLFAHRAEIARLALKSRLPTIGEWRLSAADGFLASYGADLADLLRRAAGYVDRILKGAPPRDLPIERPTKFTFVINRATARALGLPIPPAVLQRADELID
jgi:putative ABC transport system substrate-binding protein